VAVAVSVEVTGADLLAWRAGFEDMFARIAGRFGRMEIRRLWAALTGPQPSEQAILAWSNRRRQHQGRARHCHYRRRLGRSLKVRLKY
jgi:hypothetical protein